MVKTIKALSRNSKRVACIHPHVCIMCSMPFFGYAGRISLVFWSNGKTHFKAIEKAFIATCLNRVYYFIDFFLTQDWQAKYFILVISIYTWKLVFFVCLSFKNIIFHVDLKPAVSQKVNIAKLFEHSIKCSETEETFQLCKQILICESKIVNMGVNIWGMKLYMYVQHLGTPLFELLDRA